jgi:DNA-binding CsgD family transcriptional regulator
VLYGRDVERARIGALLEQARASRSGALVVRGEPGIGKTALLEDTRDRAGDMHVLSARGVESESELPFAALHQLLRPALGHVAALPEPQADALREALGLSRGTGRERFLVFAACLSLLSELAELRPVLCLVDDAHWLDAESADALRFVARRIDAEGIVVVFATRGEGADAFEAADLPVLVLEGLGDDAAARLLSAGAGVDAAPAVRSSLVRKTGGNALALLEIPAALSKEQLAGAAPLPDALPLTSQVQSVFLERVRRLPEDAQRFLLVAAADDTENAGFVTGAARRLGIDQRGLDAAEQAGLVSVHGSHLGFRHPLVRSAVYESATSSERRAAHRALAETLPDDDEHADRRVWHLAASALEPDDSVVSLLEQAAARAESRGAYSGSARALERAAQLSTSDEARSRRLVGAARAASVAGKHERAVALARHARPAVHDAVARAELARVLAVAEIQQGRPAAAVAPLMAAAREVAAADPQKALELVANVMAAATDGGDLAAQLEAAQLAEAIEIPDDDAWSSFVVRFVCGAAAMGAGATAKAAPLLDAALAWAADSEDERALYWAAAAALWIGDDHRTSALAGRAALLARERGSLEILAGALALGASESLLAQRFDEAELAADEAMQLSRELGSGNYALLGQSVAAAIAALRGRDDEARELAEETLQHATAHGLMTRAAAALRALAWLDMGRLRWAEALERLDAIGELGSGGRLFVAVSTAPDRVEAAVRAGHEDRALAALEAFEDWVSSSTAAAWARPRLASCRALVAPDEVKDTLFQEALDLADDARPFDLARIRLLYGEHLRRSRRRLDARTQLRAALEDFERLGLEPWAERARTELRGTGETARRRDPRSVDQLTAQELQIARYVAEGLSNKEIAAKLFLSPRTIDSHLRNVFAKLSITSRFQLARLPLGTPGHPARPAEVSSV